MSDPSAQIAANLAEVNDRVRAACRYGGRAPEDVQLVAVTKYARLEWVQALIDLGQSRLGESRPQQLVERASALTGPVAWHLIGHLQRNKVRSVLPHTSLIHSVDSLRLARRISDIAAEASITARILLEVSISGEAAKDGFLLQDLNTTWGRLVELPHLEIAGLMTMAPAAADPEAARPTFAGLRQLRDDLLADSPVEVTLGELSMGMSGDFEVAIEEGATLIRIGSALFEGLSE